LEQSNTTKTKSGANIEFQGSTGVKGSAKALTVVPPNGAPKQYYLIVFSQSL